MSLASPSAGPGRPSRHFRLDQPPAAPRGEYLRAVLRGVRNVVVLVLSAVVELVTALLGIPPLGPRVRKIRAALAEAYRDGVEDIRPAEVVGPDDVIGDEW